MKKLFLTLLLVANLLVLLGHLWPAGVPPFADKFTLGFLLTTASYFAFSLSKLRWIGRRKAAKS